jgi:hypothetical protein
MDLGGVVYWLFSAPLAVAALLAIPYTIIVRRRRRLARRAQIGEPMGDPIAADEPPRREPSDDPYLWLRLVVAFVICTGLAWVCYSVLPRIGVDAPWWVPVLCFGIILAAAVLRRAAEPQQADSGESGVAGRIGPEGLERMEGREPPG